MKKKKITKESKRRLLIFGTISCICVIYFFFTLISYTYNIQKLSNEQQSLSDNLDELRDEEENLRNQILKLQDPEYIARYARENYLYSKDGEYVLKIEDSETETTTNDIDFIEEYKNYIILGTVIVLIIIIYILKTLKKK